MSLCWGHVSASDYEGLSCWTNCSETEPGKPCWGVTYWDMSVKGRRSERESGEVAAISRIMGYRMAGARAGSRTDRVWHRHEKGGPGKWGKDRLLGKVLPLSEWCQRTGCLKEEASLAPDVALPIQPKLSRTEHFSPLQLSYFYLFC